MIIAIFNTSNEDVEIKKYDPIARFKEVSIKNVDINSIINELNLEPFEETKLSEEDIEQWIESVLSSINHPDVTENP